MKKWMLAAALLAGAFAFAEDDGDGDSGSSSGSYEDWFTPSVPFANQSRTAEFSYMDGSQEKSLKLTGLSLGSDLLECEAAVEDAIQKASMKETAKNAFILAKTSLANSVKALLDAEKNEQMIQSLGASIETIFSLTTADKVDSSGATISSGKLADGMRDKLLAKKNAVMGGKNPSGGDGSDDKPLQITVTDFAYDTHEFEQIAMNGNKSKMGLKGYKSLRHITSWPPTNPWLGASTKGYIPFSVGYTGSDPNDLEWKSWAGFDDTLFKASTKQGDEGQVTLVGWNEGSKCAETMSKMLSKPELAQDRLKHAVLARYDAGGGNHTLHWVGIGDTIGGIGNIDELSIVTNTALGSIADGTVSMYGFNTARASAGTAGEKYLAYVEDSDTALQWGGLSTLTDPLIFEADGDNDGQLTIIGASDAFTAAATDNEPYLLNADPEGEEIHWTAASALFNENVFTKDSNGKIIINGIDDYEEGDLMVISAYGEDEEQTVEGVKLRKNQFEWTGGQLYLKGSLSPSATCSDPLNVMLTSPSDTQNRNNHYFLARYTNSSGDASDWHWVKITGVIPTLYADDQTIVTNATKGSIEDGKASLYGWATAKSSATTASMPYIPTAQGNDNIDWEKLEDLFDPYEFEADTDNGGIMTIKGFADAIAAAADDGEPYILNADPEDDDIHWTAASALFNENVFTKDSDGKIILNGMDDIGADDIMVVTAQGEDTEQEVEGVKLDAGQFEKSNGKLILKGSAAASATCSAPLNVMLSSASDTQNRQRHRMLALYTEGNTREFHWVPITGTIGGIGAVDDASVTTNASHGATADGVLSAYGWASAVESAADGVPYLPYADPSEDAMQWKSVADFFDENEFEADEDTGAMKLLGFTDADDAAASSEDGVPYVPCADGAGSLAWGAFSDFFSENVFKTSSTGKILLNGTSDDDSKYSVIAIKGGNTDQQQVKTLAFDESSIDGNFSANTPIQLHAFANAPSPYTGKNFADALTNTSVNIQGFSVPVRIPTGGKNNGPSVAYIPMGKVTGIPSANVDDITIEINKTDPNNEFLQLHGAAGEGITLEDGDVYAIKDGKGKFVSITGDYDGEWAHPSLETACDDNGNICLSLYGWNNLIEGNGVIGWDSEHELKYFDGNSMSRGISIDDNAGLQLDKYSSANRYAIPYKDSWSGNEDSLGWVNIASDRLLMGKENAAPIGLAVGASLDKANVSAVPTLNIAGFTAGGNCSASLNDMLSKSSESQNRSRHQIMARYSTGSGTPSVHWIPINGTIGGGAPVDGVSITTNTTHGAVTQGEASIRGYATQSGGAIPFKAMNGNNMDWIAKPSGSQAKVLKFNGSNYEWGDGGGSIKFIGTDNSEAIVGDPNATDCKTVTFASKSDSNVQVSVSGTDGNVTVSIGVYYK